MSRLYEVLYPLTQSSLMIQFINTMTGLLPQKLTSGYS